MRQSFCVFVLACLASYNANAIEISHESGNSLAQLALSQDSNALGSDQLSQTYSDMLEGGSKKPASTSNKKSEPKQATNTAAAATQSTNTAASTQPASASNTQQSNQSASASDTKQTQSADANVSSDVKKSKKKPAPPKKSDVAVVAPKKTNIRPAVTSKQAAEIEEDDLGPGKTVTYMFKGNSLQEVTPEDDQKIQAELRAAL